MAKRFIDTEKFKTSFFRSLPSSYKILWDYVCLDCNHAGIWIVDFEIAQIYIGKDCCVNEKEAIRLFNSGKTRVVPIDGGKRWFISSFIDFQYGILNPENRAHNSVISQLVSYGLWDEGLGVIKPLASPLQGCRDIDKDMDKDSRGVWGDDEGNKSIEKEDTVDIVNCTVTGTQWRKEYDSYISSLTKCCTALKNNPKWVAERKEYNPGVDVLKSMKKSFVEYWATKAGWQKKKASRSNTIDWKRTMNTAISMNKVYLPKQTDETVTRKQVLL